MKPDVNITDAHWPMHNKLFWKLALECIRIIEPTRINLLGDNFDPAAISHWEKNIAARMLLKEQIEDTIKCEEELRAAAPVADIVMIPGNHEEWFMKFLIEKAPELQFLDTLHLTTILKLDNYGITFKPGPFWRHDLYHMHGHELRLKSPGVYPAKNFFLKKLFGHKTLMGHWHIINTYLHAIWERDAVRTDGVWINGTLIDTKQVTYDFRPAFHYSITLVYYTSKGLAYPQQVQFHEEDGVAWCYLAGQRVEVGSTRAKISYKRDKQGRFAGELLD